MSVEDILIAAGVAAVVSLLASLLVLRIGLRFKLYPVIRERDVHTRPTPRLGGVAMYVGLLAGLATAWQLPASRELVFDQNGKAVLAVVIAATLIVLTGVLDDLLDLHWSIKLFAQAVGAIVLAVIGGLQITQLPVGGFAVLVSSNLVSLTTTLFVTLVVINMMNFIDGLDGLVAGIAIIANITYFIYTFLLTERAGGLNLFGLGLLLSALTCAICAGFLVLNWHPAKLFMGDSGSMLVGLLFAATSISISGNIDPLQFFAVDNAGHYIRAGFAPAFLPLLLPLAVMIVPVLDFGLAITRRLFAGKSPFTADRKHLHHRLLDMGHSHLHATLIFYGVTVVISIGSLMFYLVSPTLVGWSFIAGGLMLCTSLTLLPLSRRKRQEQDTQTRPITLITPEMAALDRLDKASMRNNTQT